jgi:hypothetical protein
LEKTLTLPLIGLSGKGQAGKDTVADYLVSIGWKKKVSLAGSLKRFCSNFFGVDLSLFYSQEGKSSKLSEPIDLEPFIADIIESALGEYARIPSGGKDLVVTTPRELLQKVGTNVLRVSDPNCFVMMLEREYGDLTGYIISDVRFPNEADFVICSSGVLVRIERPGKTISSNHLSETALDVWENWSYVLKNDTDGLDNLYKKVDFMLKSLGGFHETSLSNN